MKLHRVYWEGWALWMDYISLFTLPTLYTIALAVLFSWVHRMPPPTYMMYSLFDSEPNVAFLLTLQSFK